MLRDFTNSLKFPKLIRTGETKLRNETEPVDLYQLKFQCDQDVDDQLRKKGRVMITEYEREEYQQAVSRIPPQYNWIHDLTFALKPNYLREIRHCAIQAALEWSRHRGFDTCIREACLKPAISYVQTAFMLLQDCIYDPQTGHWDYNEEKRGTVKYLLGFKFWFGQTGLGLVIPHSGLTTCIDSNRTYGAVKKKHLADYYDRMDALYNALDDVIGTEIAKNVHPDIAKAFTKPENPSEPAPDPVKQKEELVETLKKCSKVRKKLHKQGYTDPETIRIQGKIPKKS